VGEATPSQTGWALLVLLSSLHGAPELDPDGFLARAAGRAAVWLVEQQDDDGGWTDQLFTGTGFPRAFYLRYEMYATVFPVMALARLALPGRAFDPAP